MDPRHVEDMGTRLAGSPFHHGGSAQVHVTLHICPSAESQKEATEETDSEGFGSGHCPQLAGAQCGGPSTKGSWEQGR